MKAGVYHLKGEVTMNSLIRNKRLIRAVGMLLLIMFTSITIYRGSILQIVMQASIISGVYFLYRAGKKLYKKPLFFSGICFTAAIMSTLFAFNG
jgi:hypothetical protein